LTQALAEDQIEETVEISIGLSKQSAGEVHADYLYPSAEIALPEIYKPQKYALEGYARMKPGKRVKVEGQGILLAQDYLAEAVNRPTAVGGFLAVWKSIMRDIDRADPDANLIAWQTPGASGNEEIAAAEKRLGMQFPAFYRETMQRSGPWQMSVRNSLSFDLLAPLQLISVSDWLNGVEGWSGPENQEKRQAFKQDIIFAIANDVLWVMRRSGKACGDDQPSFAIGKVAEGKFYVSEAGVCGAAPQLEAIRRQMLDALTHALPSPEFTVVGGDQRLHFERNKLSAKTLQLYLKADG
jgi:hypothetical protein